MILSKFIQVKVMGKNIMRYKNLGYIFNAGDNVKIDINDIPNKSKMFFRNYNCVPFRELSNI